MVYDITEDDWIVGAERRVTPNVTLGARIKPLYLVFYDAEPIEVYLDESSCRKSSMHLYVYANGWMEQLCPLTAKAWHAGKSYYQGHNGINSFGIGIAVTPSAEKRQRETLDNLVMALVEHYNIRDIVRHSDISDVPQTQFDVSKYKPLVEYGNAESGGRYTVAVPEKQMLRVRGGPGVEFEIIDRLQNGDSVKVLRTRDMWHAITYERQQETRSRQGWALETFLRRA